MRNCVTHHSCDCITEKVIKLERKNKQLIEALRKAVLWGECVSQRLPADKRSDLNWNYLVSSRSVLDEIACDRYNS